MAMFEAHGLSKRFGDRVVLEHVDLAFEEHRISGIMGPNGAGKTTCFNVLTGMLKPDRGRVLMDGEDITGLPERKIARRGVSRSFQLMNVFDEYTALQNVQVALPRMRRRSFDMLTNVDRSRALTQAALSVLERVGLADQARTEARRLSYGDRRALEIGIALAAEPRILFLDEPTQGLGADQTGRVADLIRELKKQQVTLVIIEHDMPFLFGVAEEISVIHWGQVIDRGTPGELRANPWVMRSNLGKFQ